MQCSDFTLGLDSKVLKADLFLDIVRPAGFLNGGIMTELAVKAKSPSKYCFGEKKLLGRWFMPQVCQTLLSCTEPGHQM